MHHFHDVEPSFGFARLETLRATGCFCLNKNHTLSRCASGNYSSRDSEKLLWLWLLAYFIFNLVRRPQRRRSKIYRMMSKIFSPSRLPANRLLPQWLGEKQWNVAAAFVVMHRQTRSQPLHLNVQKKKDVLHRSDRRIRYGSSPLWGIGWKGTEPVILWRVGSVCVFCCLSRRLSSSGSLKHASHDSVLGLISPVWTFGCQAALELLSLGQSSSLFEKYKHFVFLTKRRGGTDMRCDRWSIKAFIRQ